MIRVIIAIIVIVRSCSLSDAIAPQLSVGRVADLTHHIITKRQATPTLQNVADCSATTIDYQCGSSGYAQQIVNIALGCRNESYARNAANACASNENGEFCGTATVRFSVDQIRILTACQGAVSSRSCPSSCRSLLQSASSTLGCCINTYINTTVNPLLGLYDYVDYRLWSLCNVPLPPADCGNGLPLNPPQDSRVCTLQELLTRLANYGCMPSAGQGLVDALVRDSRCYTFAKSLVDGCAVNENNEFCVAVVGSNLIDSGSSTDSEYTSLAINCVSSSSSFCSSSCQNAVTNIANSHGCCVNVFNISIGGIQVPQLSYSLWNRCGVDTPGFCSASTLSTSGTATIKVLFAWMIALAMAALYI